MGGHLPVAGKQAVVEHVLLFILLQIFVKYFTDKVDGNFSSTEKPDQKTSLMSGGLIQILAGFKVAFLIYPSDVCVMCVCLPSLIAVHGAPSSCSSRISFSATRFSVSLLRPLKTVAYVP